MFLRRNGTSWREWSRVSTVVTFVALMGVAALAVGVRATTLKAGAPYTSYTDEHFPLKASAYQIANETWDPGSYFYPSFVISATTVSAWTLASIRGEERELRRGARASIESPFIEVVEPWTLIVAGRLVVFTLAIATVLMTALLGIRLAGRLVGVLAGAIVAVIPMFVTRASIVIVDTPATFFAVAALYGLARVSSAETTRRRAAWSAASGVAGGLAFTSKYTLGSILLGTLVVVALRADRPVGERLRLGLLAVGTFVATAVLIMPALVFRTSQVRRALALQDEGYRVALPGAPNHYYQLVQAREVGRLLVVTGLVGIVLLLWRRRARAVTFGYLAFAIPPMMVLSRYPFQPVRSLLPFVPFLVVAAAAAIVGAVRFITSRVHAPAVVTAGAAALVVIVVCWAPGSVWTRQYIRDQRHLTDTRISARRWLATHARAGERVLVAQELAFLGSELRRICIEVDVSPQRLPAPAGTYDWFVAGDLEPRTHPLAWSNGLATRRPAVTFGDYPMAGENLRTADQPLHWVWHHNRERIHVFGPVDATRRPTRHCPGPPPT